MFLFFSLIKGILIGLLISIPTGPVGFLCLERTLVFNRRAGFASGLGSVTADAFYASVVLFGLHHISDFIKDFQPEIRLVGSILLLYIGTKILIEKKENKNTHHLGDGSDTKNFLSSFLITMTNPIQIITFGILFSFIGENYTNFHQTSFFIFGLLIGAIFWWGSLTIIVDKYRHKIGERASFIIARFSGIFILATGLVALLSLLL